MRFRSILMLLLCLVIFPSAEVFASGSMDRPETNLTQFAFQSNLDHVWTMTAAGLVFLMQVGFLLLESGMVRAKNSINVAQKNIADFIIATMLFGAIGFMIMFGTSVGGVIGFDLDLLAFDSVTDWTFTFFVFQVVFCGTAATIISGAAAERTKVAAYMITAAFIGCILYPIFGHWAWGGLLNTANEPWLASLGFMDFAGSTVVHSTGAWAALAVIVVAGARKGRFDENGNPQRIQGHNAVLATAGCLILWIGWVGFNGGSTTAGTSAFAHIISNTVVAGATGGLTAMIIGRYREGLYRPERSINGVIAGLVAITAGCDVFSTWEAILVASAGALIAYMSESFILHKLKLDDVIEAISVHGVAGAWGTLAIGFFASSDSLLAGSRLAQIGVQFLGVGVCFVWAFGLTYVFLKFVNRFNLGDDYPGIRISPEHEKIGLNVAEHGATLGTGILQEAMQKLATGEADFSERLNIDVGDEAGELAALFNMIMDNIEQEKNRMQELADNELKLREQQSQMEEDAKKQRLEDRQKSEEKQREKLNALVDRFENVISQTIGNISHSVTQLEESSNMMVDVASGTSQEVGTANNAVDEANNQVKNVLSATQKLSALMDRIEKHSTEARQVNNDAEQKINVTNSVIDKLDLAAKNIGQIIGVIEEIASQTHMLALNATIEAVRAGESGKSFNVVANEVKSLASQTASATEQVSQQIQEIQLATREAVGGISNVGQSLEDISRTSKDITDTIHLQSETIGEISQTTNITADFNSTAYASMEKVEEASHKSKEAALEVRQSSEKIRKDAQTAEQDLAHLIEEMRKSA